EEGGAAGACATGTVTDSPATARPGKRLKWSGEAAGAPASRLEGARVSTARTAAAALTAARQRFVASRGMASMLVDDTEPRGNLHSSREVPSNEGHRSLPVGCCKQAVGVAWSSPDRAAADLARARRARGRPGGLATRRSDGGCAQLGRPAARRRRGSGPGGRGRAA